MDVSALARVAELLSNPTRLKILELLRESPLSPGDLQRRLGVPQSTLSTHLQMMHRANLVNQRSYTVSGKPPKRYEYSVNGELLKEVTKALAGLIPQQMVAA